MLLLQCIVVTSPHVLLVAKAVICRSQGGQICIGNRLGGCIVPIVFTFTDSVLSLTSVPSHLPAINLAARSCERWRMGAPLSLRNPACRSACSRTTWTGKVGSWRHLSCGSTMVAITYSTQAMATAATSMLLALPPAPTFLVRPPTPP